MTMELAERTIGGLHEALAARVQPLAEPSAAVLDIGCGSGAWLARLHALGFTNLHGIDRDISQTGFAQASYQRADLDDVPSHSPDRGCFDLITAIDVLEHLANPGNLFSLAARCLAPNGSLLVTTPNIHSTVCRLRYLVTGKLKQFDDKGDLTHIYPVLLTSLQRVLPRYGFMIAAQWPFPTSGASPTTASRSLRICSRIIAPFVPEPCSGDVLCLLIQRRR
jgi:2-polyprenyl-3-methyl-5-hydroxy-6-metoxy-1,4-benzoquinol methylase